MWIVVCLLIEHVGGILMFLINHISHWCVITIILCWFIKLFVIVKCFRITIKLCIAVEPLNLFILLFSLFWKECWNTVIITYNTYGMKSNEDKMWSGTCYSSTAGWGVEQEPMSRYDSGDKITETFRNVTWSWSLYVLLQIQICRIPKQILFFPGNHFRQHVVPLLGIRWLLRWGGADSLFFHKENKTCQGEWLYCKLS